MKIGSIEILPVEYGRFRLDGGAIFGIVPKTLWEKHAPADEKNRIELALRGMLIRIGSSNILVDTGPGNKMSEKLSNIYAVDYTRYSLEDSLNQMNINFDHISDVILTHLHFDHAGGATDINGQGRIVPTFPKAAYYVQKKQYEWAVQPSELDRASYFQEDFITLKKLECLKLLDGEQEIREGVKVIPVNGHTPGQQLVKVSSGEETILYCGDLIPTASHIHLPWMMGYDIQPMLTLEEKRNIISVAVAENWILFYEHDPRIIASRVVKKEKGFQMGEEVVV